MDANSAALLKIPKTTWWIIWGAMSSSIVLYVIVLQVIAGKSEAGDTEVEDGASLGTIMLGVAILAVLVSFSIRFLLTSRLARHPDDEKRVGAFPTYMVSLALAESAAIFGMVLGLQGSPMTEYATFFVIGFLAVILQPPTVLFPSKGDDHRAKYRRH